MRKVNRKAHNRVSKSGKVSNVRKHSMNIMRVSSGKNKDLWKAKIDFNTDYAKKGHSELFETKEDASDWLDSVKKSDSEEEGEEEEKEEEEHNYFDMSDDDNKDDEVKKNKEDEDTFSIQGFGL